MKEYLKLTVENLKLNKINNITINDRSLNDSIAEFNIQNQ